VEWIVVTDAIWHALLTTNTARVGKFCFADFAFPLTDPVSQCAISFPLLLLRWDRERDGIQQKILVLSNWWI
jgi:hypothetical protein